jgi:hypothetical protein
VEWVLSLLLMVQPVTFAAVESPGSRRQSLYATHSARTLSAAGLISRITTKKTKVLRFMRFDELIFKQQVL